MTSKNQQTPVFIVSAGRSGSTFLAKLINQHPSIVCVSDLFEPVTPSSDPLLESTKSITGSDFFNIISKPSFEPRLRYWRERQTTERLFVPEDESMVSLLMSYTIPFLDEDPMACFEAYKTFATEQPEKTASAHLIEFFDWLKERFGGDLWVERTGGALALTPDLIKTYPDAKIIHCYRDGRECSISMQNYPFFRMYLKMAQENDFVLADWDFDEMPPVEEIGKMWSEWVLIAEDAMDALPDEQKRWIGYEDLMNNAEEELTKLLLYILDKTDLSEQDQEWIKACCAQLRPSSAKLETLEPQERSALEQACAPGMQRLGYDL